MSQFLMFPADRLAQEYRKNRARMKAEAARILRDPHLAEDAMQATWLKICRAGQPPAMTPEKWRSYLLVAVHNTAVSMLRARQKEWPDEDALLMRPSAEPGPEQQTEQGEAYARLYHALAGLPRKDQDILLLKYDNGCTVEQIAVLLELPPETVKKRLYRARKKLKQEWEGTT